MTDNELHAQRVAESRARYEKSGYVALLPSEWKKLHRDFKGYNETTGHPHTLHNCGGAGTQLWPVVIINEHGNLERRQPRGRKRA